MWCLDPHRRTWLALGDCSEGLRWGLGWQSHRPETKDIYRGEGRRRPRNAAESRDTDWGKRTAGLGQRFECWRESRSGRLQGSGVGGKARIGSRGWRLAAPRASAGPLARPRLAGFGPRRTPGRAAGWPSSPAQVWAESFHMGAIVFGLKVELFDSWAIRCAGGANGNRISEVR